MTEKPQKILVIGSGPIAIGQAAEFDYAGTQACKSLREEGIETILVNSNPATIMTDEDIADIAEQLGIKNGLFRIRQVDLKLTLKDNRVGEIHAMFAAPFL